MFSRCTGLHTIYAGEGWSTAAVTQSTNMFHNATSLVGGMGTVYNDSNPKDKTYAHIDGGPSNPGYFTEKVPEAYACFTPTNETLTFYYDHLRSTRTGSSTYDLNQGSNKPGWRDDGMYDYVHNVVFAPSFANVRPTSTYYWFGGMTHLESITGINYLNTSEVTEMRYMFYNCTQLNSLDVSGFNTAKVTNMGYMFSSCTALTSLDVSNFNTAQATDLRSMFSGNSALMSIDLSNFNTAQVKNMSYMFYGCSNLRTIYAGNAWSTAAVTSSGNMFYNCTNLRGGKGTTYDANHIDAAYAHIDGGPSNPGYFTAPGQAALRGDVNGDGSVNISDVTALIDYLLSGNASGINLSGADCNQDSSVNISDVTSLIDYLLSGAW